MKEPIFKATHIVKQFGPTIALNDVDIAIYPGEIRPINDKAYTFPVYLLGA